MKEMMDLYDLDQDGVLSPVEKEQALADSHKDSPLYAMEEPDDIDLFIRANISEVLLKEAPVKDVYKRQIEGLAAKVPDCPMALSDQFANPCVLKRALAAKRCV